MSRVLLTIVALAAVSQTSTGPVPLAGTPMPDPQAGRMSQARVLVINKEPQRESIPVSLAGTPVVSVTGPVTALAQAVPQRWEYRTVIAAANTNLVTVLNDAGAEGWEATGAVVPRGDGTAVLVLKRPH